MLEKYPGLMDVFSNPKLSAHDKKLAALPYLRKINEERATLNRELKIADELLAAHKIYQEWEQQPVELEKNDCSRLHQLISSLKRTKRFEIAGEKLEMKGGDVDTFPLGGGVPQCYRLCGGRLSPAIRKMRLRVSYLRAQHHSVGCAGCGRANAALYVLYGSRWLVADA